MTPRSLFNIILKIFGLFFLREIINTIPQLFSTILYFIKVDTADEGIWTMVFTALILAFYILLVFQLLFKTNIFIDKLKLDKGFEEDEFSLDEQHKFSFDISLSAILNISLIVIGGIILVNEIPNFCKQVFSLVEANRTAFGSIKLDFSYLIVAFVKIIIALLLLGERKKLIDFIEDRQNRKETD